MQHKHMPQPQTYRRCLSAPALPPFFHLAARPSPFTPPTCRSAMDIAAIQQDTPAKIDFNAELRTVAVSNVASALTGCGFTGSYIFRCGGWAGAGTGP